MLGFAGVTAIETSVAGVTVSKVEPWIAPCAAVTVTVPVPSAVASPSKPAALLTLASAGLDELHNAVAVRSWVELSV